MRRILSIPLGVVVAREKIDNPWQDYIWRPVGVFLDAAPDAEWRELRKGEGFVHYHAATVTLELHRKEAAGYKENLDNCEQPSIYVVLREEDPEVESEWPVEVHLVTASPFDVEAYGDGGTEIIEPVAMPGELIELVRAFIDEHFVDEPFIKRKRGKYHRKEDHHFGKEPIVELRERMNRAGKSGQSDA